MFRQPYQCPPRIYQQPTLGFKQPYYQHQLQLSYPQTFYQTYNGFQIPVAPKQPQTIIASQTFQSPQKNFQSPSRGFTSPSRNNLMSSQQKSQSQQNPLFQSPSRTVFYTYDQVMERIKNANQQYQQKQNQQCIPQSKQQLENEYAESNQQKQAANKQFITNQGLFDNKKNVEKQIKKIEPKKTTESKIQRNEREEHVEALEELALQYEDGYIYRGQGYPPQTRQGFGMLSDNEGREVYAGYWKQNYYEGQGRLQNLQIEEIDGAFDCNNMTTIGNGWSYYEGQFVGGKMQGQGMLILSNGEKYIGEFDDGMIHGDGEFTTLQNEVIKGMAFQKIICKQYFEVDYNWDQGYLVQMKEE